MKALLLALLVGLSAWGQTVETRLVRPALPLWVRAGETVDFEVAAPTGLRPRLDLPGGPLILTEETSGRYRGAAVLRVSGRVRLDGQDLGELAVLGDVPQTVEVTRPKSVFRCGPDPDYERYDPVTSGVCFRVTGRQGEWLRVAPPDGWIEARNVRFRPEGSALPFRQLTSVKLTESAGIAEVRLRTGAPCAFQVREEPELNRVFVVLPGVPAAMYEMPFAPDARRIPSARIHAEPDGSRLELLFQGPLSGYRSRFDGQDLVLTFAAPLTYDPESPLRGLRIVLDPGHGGKDQGAIGLHGMREKDLNLQSALALQKELEQQGALVTMTRDADRQVAEETASAEVELAARVELAEQAQGQLFVSIHHNAMANVTAGRQAHGTHVYYYTPHSRALARSLAEPLAASIGEPSHLYLWRSFAVIRQTAMPAVLVEVNFVSNPGLEQGMYGAPDYFQKVARGIRQGLEDAVRQRGEAPP